MANQINQTVKLTPSTKKNTAKQINETVPLQPTSVGQGLSDVINNAMNSFSGGGVWGPPSPGQSWEEYEAGIKNLASRQAIPHTSAKQTNKTVKLTKGDETSEVDRPSLITNETVALEPTGSVDMEKPELTPMFDIGRPSGNKGEFMPENFSVDSLFGEGGVLDPGNRDALYYQPPIIGDLLEAYNFQYEDADKVKDKFKRDDSISYDIDTGQFYDERNASDVVPSFEEATQAREADGKTMWRPLDSVARTRTEDGRIKIETDDPLQKLFQLGSQAINGINSSFMNLRGNQAIANSDMKVKTSSGKSVDLTDFLDVITPYMDSISNGEQRSTTSTIRPKDLANSIGWSSGNWMVMNRNGEWLNAGKVDQSEIGADGSTFPSGTYDPVSDLYYVDRLGIYVPVQHDASGNISPMMYPNWTEQTDDPSEAIAWTTYPPLTLPNGETISYQDVQEIFNGGEDGSSDIVYNANGNPFLKLQKDIDFDITDPLSMDLGDIASTGLDGMLSTVSYLNKPLGLANMVMMPATAAMYGVDPFSYDPSTDTYADPGSLSADQYLGQIISTAGESTLEGLMGVGGRGAGKIFNRFRNPEKIAEKELKNMNNGTLRRTVDVAGSEGFEEGLSAIGNQFARGYEDSPFDTMFANPLLDENGDMVYDDEGRIVYDTKTSMGDRVLKNMIQDVGTNAAIGSMVGGLMGWPGAISSKHHDAETLEANHGYIAPKLNAKVSASDSQRKEMEDYYEQYLKSKGE